MMFYCLKTVEICDTWLSTVVHFLYSILLRLMKSRQKRVWTFCRTLLNITMHNASKCCNALSFSYCFLHKILFPFVSMYQGFFHDCVVPGVWIFLFFLPGQSVWVSLGGRAVMEKEAEGKLCILHAKNNFISWGIDLECIFINILFILINSF